MTTLDMAALTQAQRDVLGQIAIGQDGGHLRATLAALEKRGLIVSPVVRSPTRRGADVTDGGWEHRMAARAAQRAATALPTVRTVDPFWREFAAWQRTTVAGMTLGDAVEWLRAEPIGCACHGGPACCIYRGQQVVRLQRAAHVVARLLADRAATPTPTEEN